MSKIITWIKKEMVPGEWYNLKPGTHDKYKNLYEELLKQDIELTFNKDFTKIKKTVWVQGKPICEKRKYISMKLRDTIKKRRTKRTK